MIGYSNRIKSIFEKKWFSAIILSEITKWKKEVSGTSLNGKRIKKDHDTFKKKVQFS